MQPHLRVARATSSLNSLVAMYRDGLALEELGGFTDHDGFDGVMLGVPDAQYHLEFTQQAGHAAPRSPSPESLLIFYQPDEEAWRAACARMLAAGFAAVPSHNPYWDARGKTFEDIDGYRVVMQQSGWPPRQVK